MMPDHENTIAANLDPSGFPNKKLYLNRLRRLPYLPRGCSLNLVLFLTKCRQAHLGRWALESRSLLQA